MDDGTQTGNFYYYYCSFPASPFTLLLFYPFVFVMSLKANKNLVVILEKGKDFEPKGGCGKSTTNSTTTSTSSRYSPLSLHFYIFLYILYHLKSLNLISSSDYFSGHTQLTAQPPALPPTRRALQEHPSFPPSLYDSRTSLHHHGRHPLHLLSGHPPNGWTELGK